MRNDDDCYERGLVKRLLLAAVKPPARAPREQRGAPVTGSWTMIMLVVVVILGYVGSLWINPWVKCSRCNGVPRKKALLFGHAHRICSKCKGTGRQIRLGRRFIFGPPR